MCRAVVVFVAIIESFMCASAQQQDDVQSQTFVVASLGGAYGESLHTSFQFLDFKPSSSIPDTSLHQSGMMLEIEWRYDQVFSLVGDIGYHWLTFSRPAYEEWEGGWFSAGRLVAHHERWELDATAYTAALAVRFRTSGRSVLAAVVEFGLDYRWIENHTNLDSIWPRFCIGASIRPRNSFYNVLISAGAAHGGMVIRAQVGLGFGRS